MRILFVYFNRFVRPRTLPSVSLLETILKNNGHKTMIFDTSFYDSVIDQTMQNSIKSGIFQEIKNIKIPIKISDPYSDFKDTVQDFMPELIAFSYYSINSDLHDRFFGKIKKDFPGIKIVCGGPTPSINTNECFKNDYIDMVCCGEGEGVLLELVDRMDRGDRIDSIRGLWIRKGDKVINNGVAPLTDLKTLPTPDWDSYDPIQIYGVYEGNAYRMGHVEFNRGCPYDCTYCGSGSIKQIYVDSGFKKYSRYKSPEQFVKECAELRDKYDLQVFYFCDGTFTSMSKDVLRRLSKLYNDKVKVPFICLVHPLTIDRETAELLSKMGCIQASIGVESGDEEFRRNILNRYMTDDQIINAVHCLKSQGIHVTTYNMIGIPGMDREHVFKTINLNRLANPQSSMATIFIPFLDSKLTKTLIKTGLCSASDITKISNGMYQTITIEDMSRKEINGLFYTFNMYVRLPKFLHMFVRLLENENFVTRILRRVVYRLIDIKKDYNLYKIRKRING